MVSFCRFVHVSSAGVTRPDRPGLDLSKQPPAVRLNKELGFILTYKLKVLYSNFCLFRELNRVLYRHSLKRHTVVYNQI